MEENRYDVVVVFPFGKGRNASYANKVLLRRAVEEATRFDAPLIMHESMPTVENLKAKLLVTAFGGRTICEYARNVREDMARETWKNALVIAAIPIMDRCMSDLRRVYPGQIEFHDGRQVFKDAPYGHWFWAKGVRWYRSRAIARFLFEELLFFVPWPIYRRLAAPSRKG